MCEQGPFEDPPVWEQIPNSSVPSRFWDQTWGSMLNAVDNGLGNLYDRKPLLSVVAVFLCCCVAVADRGNECLVVGRTAVLHSSGMWPDTLIVMTSDNGGDCQHGQPANNYP